VVDGAGDAGPMPGASLAANLEVVATRPSVVRAGRGWTLSAAWPLAAGDGGWIATGATGTRAVDGVFAAGALAGGTALAARIASLIDRLAAVSC
jgi:hypothetical protein